MNPCPNCLEPLEGAGPCPRCGRYRSDIARRRAAHFFARATAAMAAGQLGLAAELVELSASYDLAVVQIEAAL